ncbi:sorbosone dehydrogenase family protein, partial [Acinetobacter baumannii]|nr:sorbosone dehydrogenase family protein [Acinetobacter baumannii]
MLTRFLLPILGTTVLVTGCASSSQYPINESYGPEPKLPEPKTSLFPTVNIAPAQG